MLFPHWTNEESANIQALAAVLQAGLTIAALGIAIWIPTKQRKAEQKDRALASALLLVPAVIAIANEARSLQDRIRTATALEVPGPDYYPQQPNAVIESAEKLARARQELVLLSPDMLLLVMRLQAILDRHAATPSLDTAKEVELAAQRLIARLNLAIPVADLIIDLRRHSSQQQ